MKKYNDTNIDPYSEHTAMSAAIKGVKLALHDQQFVKTIHYFACNIYLTIL